MTFADLKLSTGAIFFNPNGERSSGSLVRVSICRTATECRPGQRMDESTGRCGDCDSAALTAGPGSFSTSTNATECEACARCRSDPAGGTGFAPEAASQYEYEAAPCSLTSDTVCADYHRQCTADQFIAAAATQSSDTACASCRVRVFTAFQTSTLFISFF